MQQSTKSYKEERIDFVIGVCVIVAAIALFGWLVWRTGRNVRSGIMPVADGKIVSEGVNIRGKEQIYTFVPTQTIEEGATIVWTVDGNVVQEGVYSQGEPMELHYTHSQTGVHEISATAGRYTQTLTTEVAAPLLTITAPNITVVYVEEPPRLQPQIEGFVGDEQAEFCYDGFCTVENYSNKAGIYRIVPDSCDYCDYRTECVAGTLTVLPRELSVEGQIVKCYDGTNFVENPSIQVHGMLEGDDVRVQCEKLYLENKNVGEKLALLGTATLAGEDACNYVLADFAQALIVPKALALTGTKVQNKIFDGTTKVTIDKMGTLEGVCDGDSVAIGNIEMHFDGADVGLHNVKLDNISLVGADKDNYVLVRVEGCEGEIVKQSNLFGKQERLTPAGE